ncbi:hypothetical protein DFH08DRAFT_973544 [Mycena albidolilacea]|uniref:Uncharacterized protein n=1 Tax=Mycena albidolilacea TaxID=1033008 RepID=A0AAD6Z9C3_9AGAR|nr:hypothetical protein DFH08DRAFT_973544 [Mycena albidolilacea]
MSLQTGILSNTNNDLSQRMARNSQRQSTAARKVRETRDAADTSKQLQLQIDAEVEKHRASSQLTKDLRAQLKAAKSGRGKVANLSASSSGHVKTTRGRSGAQTTVLPTQSDHFDNIPTASEPSVTEFDVNIPPAPSTADFIDPAFDSTFAFMSHFEFNNLLSDVEHLNAVFAADNILPTFDPGYLDCGGSVGFGTSVPDSGSMFDNPADFMDLYGLPAFFSDPIGTSDFSLFAPSDSLPLLPPPPPDSPPGASPTAEEPASSAPKSRRGPRREVDEANIMTSTRSRVPSTRKRVADEAPISNCLPKKGKGRQGVP